MLRRCVNSIDKEFSDLLHSLCDSGCTVMLTGHAVGGNVALLLSNGIYYVRTFGSIEIGADADPDQTLTRHYRLQGDTISQRSHTRNNIKTLPFDGSASDAHNMLEILSTLLHPGRVFALDKRTKNSLLDMQALKESFEETHRLAVIYETEPINGAVHAEAQIVVSRQEKPDANANSDNRLAHTRVSQPESDDKARAYVHRPGAYDFSNTIPQQAAPDIKLEKQQTSHSEITAKKATVVPKDQVSSEVTNVYDTHHRSKWGNKKSHHHVEELTTQTTTTIANEQKADGAIDVTRFETTETKTKSLKIDGGLHSSNVQEITTTSTSIESKANGEALRTQEHTVANPDGSVITHEKVEVMHEMTELKVTKNAQNQETARSEVKTQFGNKTTNINSEGKKTYENGTLCETQSHTTRQAAFESTGTSNIEQGVERTVTTATEGSSRGHLAKTVRTTTEEQKNFDTVGNTTTYSNQQTKTVIVSSGAKDGLAGNFVNETVERRLVDGVEKERIVHNARLNAGTERALGATVIASLETAMECYSKWKKGEKIEKKYLAHQFVNLLTSIGEGYFAAQAGEIIAATEHLDKALPQAAWAMTVAFLARNGYNLMTMTSEDRKTKLAGLMTSEGLASAIEVTGSIARTGLQLVLVGLKCGYSGPTMFGIDLVVNTTTQLLATLTKHGFSSKALLECGKIVIKSTVTAGVGILASTGTVSAMAYLFGASATVGMSVLTGGMGALAFFAATNLCTKYLWGSSPAEDIKRAKEEQDYRELLQKYLTTLFLLQENKKLHGDKDPTKLSFLQRAVDTLQSVIRRFLKQEPKTENELRELLEPLEQNMDIPECNPEAQKCFKEATNIIDGFFSKLKYPDLQQYAASFASNGYDNEQHLFDIADNEVELNRVLDICGAKLQGHRDRFRLALKDLKQEIDQGRVSYSQLLPSDTQSPYSWFMP